MAKLFNFKDVRNHPSRNGFDLSSKHAFTAKAGEILPVNWQLCLPGDSFKIRTQHMTRTVPVQTAAFTRIREYFDWFFVPSRLLWKSFPSAITQMTENTLQAATFDSPVEIGDEVPYLRLSDLLNYATNGISNPSVVSALGFHQDTSTDELKKNYFGFYRFQGALKLFSYLGYCRLSNIWFDENASTFSPTIDLMQFKNLYTYDVPVNIFPLLAYQKIYYDFFRNSQWEKSSPFCYNVDYSSGGLLTLPSSNSPYWEGSTMFDLRYCNYNKDLFFGLLPESQYGDPASVLNEFEIPAENFTIPSRTIVVPETPVLQKSDNGNVTTADLFYEKQYDENAVPVQYTKTNVRFASLNKNVGSADTYGGSLITEPRAISLAAQQLQFAARTAQSQFTILQLRMQEYLQRYREIQQCGSQDYKDQIYRIWGVKLPNELSGLCTYVGGSPNNIDISEVVNQTLGDGQQADLKGKGVGVDDHSIKFTAKEHGILMCVYHAVPVLDYDISGINRNLLKTTVYDYANPLLDKIGFEELESVVMENSPWIGFELPPESLKPFTLGYVPRYVEYKTAVDRVSGDFTDTAKDWLAPVDDSYFISAIENREVTYNFFKVNPHILDSIFAVNADSFVRTDTFRINSYFDVKVVRNLDYNGLPY